MAEPIDFVTAMKKMVDSRLYEINTSLPATIVSYANGRASVQPTPKKRFSDGDVITFPILQNVRVCWPSFAGGKAGVKGPISNGDRCLLIFAQQAVDGTDDMRKFDLSDAYCIPTDLGNVGSGGDNSSMAIYYGGASVKISAGGAITITAPAGLSIQASSVTSSSDIVAAGISVKTHKHIGVTPGGGQTGTPV